MSSNCIIALVGMSGSGKSVVADRLVEKDFFFIRFGQITLDIVKERGLEPTEKNEQKIRLKVREEHGMAAYAILNFPKIDEALKTSNVVIDGLYSWSEYKALKERYSNQLVVVAVYASPEIRYRRLAGRTEIDEKMRNRPATYEQAKARDYHEIEEIEKGGPIAMADYTIMNDRGLNELNKKIDQFFAQLEED